MSGEKSFDAAIFGQSPWKDITVFKVASHDDLNPHTVPEYFIKFPSEQDLYERAHGPREDFFTTSPIWRQRRVPYSYTGSMRSFIDSAAIKLADLGGLSPVIFRQHKISALAQRTINDDRGIISEPDFSNIERSTGIDVEVNSYIAFKSVQGDPAILPDSRSVSGLEEVANAEGLKLDLNALRIGFISIIGEQTVKALIEKGLLDPSQLNMYFSDACGFMYDIAKKQLNLERSRYAYPFPSEPQWEESIDPRALVYGASSTLIYAAEIPTFVKAGEYFRHDELATHLDKMYRSLKDLVNRRLLLGEDYIEGELTMEQVELFGQIAANLMKEYRRYPSLLNRGLPPGSSQGEVPTLKTIRQQIIAAGGGRGSRKPLLYRVRQATRSGQV